MLKSKIAGKPGVHVIHGFPRNFENLDLWNRNMIRECDVVKAINFECDDNVLMERCKKRAETQGRSDDNDNTVKKRIETYRKITQPLVDWFKSSKMLETVNTMVSKDEVFG